MPTLNYNCSFFFLLQQRNIHIIIIHYSVIPFLVRGLYVRDHNFTFKIKRLFHKMNNGIRLNFPKYLNPAYDRQSKVHLKKKLKVCFALGLPSLILFTIPRTEKSNIQISRISHCKLTISATQAAAQRFLVLNKKSKYEKKGNSDRCITMIFRMPFEYVCMI